VGLLPESAASAGRAFSPGELHGDITTKAPRFKGYRQHDAQELMRYMLDVIQEEELRRLKRLAEAAAATAAGVDGGVAPVPAAPLPVDVVTRLFGGWLVNVVMCCECGHASAARDPFLDVSLPIPHSESAGWGHGGGATFYPTRGSAASRNKHKSHHRPRQANLAKPWHIAAGKRAAGGKGKGDGYDVSVVVVTAPTHAAKKLSKEEKARLAMEAEFAALAREMAASQVGSTGPPAATALPDLCPAVDSEWLEEAPKTALVEWLQKHGKLTILTKLNIKRDTPPQ